MVTYQKIIENKLIQELSKQYHKACDDKNYKLCNEIRVQLNKVLIYGYDPESIN